LFLDLQEAESADLYLSGMKFHEERGDAKGSLSRADKVVVK
jgi:hypothetical protein